MYDLTELGFTEGEERAYIALLRIGTSTTGKIAKESGLSRSKLYEVLEKLAKKGVVSHFKRNNVQHYKAAPPDQISEYLKKREEKLKAQRIDFQKHIPLFNKLVADATSSKEAEVFEGVEGIKVVRENALREMKPGEEMYFLGNPASGHENVLGYWDDWNRRRIANKINAQIVYNQDARKFGERRKRQQRTKVRYLPKKGASHAWIEIYGDTLVIALKYKTPMSVVINNALVAESFRLYFRIIWDVSK